MAFKIRFTDFLGREYTEAELAEAGTVKASAASRILAYEVAVTYIARAMTKCELQVIMDGEPVKDELYYALNIQPNPNQSGSELMMQLVNAYYHDGSALMVMPFRNRNQFYIADSYGLRENPLGRDVYTDVTVRGKRLERSIRAGNAGRVTMHERRLMDTLKLAADAMSELLQASRDAYTRDSGERYTFSTEGRETGTKAEQEAAQKALNERLRAFVRGTNIIMPLHRGQSIERLQKSTASSADPIALRKDIFDMTGQALGIPTSLMQGNMTNASEITGQFLSFAIDPLAEEIADEMTRCFFPYEEWNGGRNRVEVNTSRITHADLFQVAADVDKLIGSGFTSIDELRSLVPGLQPIGEDYAQAHWITKNYSNIQAALEMLDGDGSGGGDNNAR